MDEVAKRGEKGPGWGDEGPNAGGEQVDGGHVGIRLPPGMRGKENL